MKKLVMLVSLLGLMVGVFAGCNESSSDTKSAADTNAPPPASTNK